MDITTISLLLVNPEQSEYALIGQLLQQVDHMEYQLDWCHQLSAAHTKVISGRYDVILLDYHWPNGTGRDLLQEARTNGCNTPIVVMTDRLETSVDREAIRVGAADYLIKGEITSDLLERTIRYAIDRKNAELHLSRLAHYDPLTNIPNRILFRDRLEHAIQLAKRDHVSFALIYMDLNGFKQVNDTYGHDVGDELIRACAQRLCSCMRRSDSVARIGGDEFTILLEHTDNTGDIAYIADKIIHALQRPFNLGNQQVVIGCSLGVALYPEAGRDADTLLRHADMAMYQAKEQAGNSYSFFTEAMNLEVREQLLLESDMRLALRREEFVLHYQPRLELETGRFLGFEALLRWQHPKRGLLTPSAFIDAAEKTGLIVALGYWVIRQVCEDFAELRNSHQGDVFGSAIVSLNLSLRQFNDDRLVERIGHILQETGMDGELLEFELTESVLMGPIEKTKLSMRALANLGPRFALDDFGSGSSSFKHLQQLPISGLVIDRSFIGQCVSDSSIGTLVTAIINLAHSLGLDVIAKGVETFTQQDFLQRHHCEQVQGFLYSRPQPIQELVDHVDEQDTALSPVRQISPGL